MTKLPDIDILTASNQEERVLAYRREALRFFVDIDIDKLPNICDLQQTSPSLLHKTEILRRGLTPTAGPIAKKWVARNWHPLWRVEDLRPLRPDEQELGREAERILRRRRQEMKDTEAETSRKRPQLLLKRIREAARNALGPNTIWLDLETTGLGKSDEVIEISLMSDQGLLLNTLVRPLRTKSWDEAQKINGISPDMLSTAPEPAELKDVIQNHIQGRFLACYNASFDLDFLKRLLAEPIIHQKAFCIMRAFAQYYGQYSEHLDDYLTWSLTDAGRYFALEVDEVERLSIAKCAMGRLVHKKLAQVEELPSHHFLIDERNSAWPGEH